MSDTKLSLRVIPWRMQIATCHLSGGVIVEPSRVPSQIHRAIACEQWGFEIRQVNSTAGAVAHSYPVKEVSQSEQCFLEYPLGR